MSHKYDEYLTEHISNVQKAANWMMDHNIIPFDNYDVRNQLNKDILNHDESKKCTEEYEAYDDYFYGKEEADESEKAMIDDCFDYAWLHHIHHNDHHWQYWILNEDEGKQKALEMPLHCVYHMIADWWSFSWKENKLDEIFNWYEKHKNKMVLHPNTRKIVERSLDQIKDLI